MKTLIRCLLVLLTVLTALVPAASSGQSYPVKPVRMIGPFAIAKMSFDPNKDLALITTLVRVPEVVVVNPSLSVNTLAELIAYPKVLSDNWYGLVGPVGMPPAILKRIHAAAVAALNSPELIEQYARVSGVPMPSSPEEFVVYLAQDQAKWGKVVRTIGFKAE